MSSYYDDESTVDDTRTRDSYARDAERAPDEDTWYTKDDDDATTTTSNTHDHETRARLKAELSKRSASMPDLARENSGLPDETKNDLKEFIHLCEQIKAAKEEIKVLNDRKVELEGKISEFMLRHEIQQFDTPSGKISIVETKAVKPLNKEFLRDAISARITDPKVVEELTNLAFSKRPTTSVPKIKITRTVQK